MLNNEQIRKNVQANFRYVRDLMGLTTKAMGAKLNISQKSYAAIEEGRSCTPLNVYRLSRLAGCYMDDIFLTDISNEIPKINTEKS